MNDIVLNVEGITFRGAPAGEPWCSDLDVAREAGLKDPHAIRRTIRAAISDGLLLESDVRAVSDQRSETGGRPGSAFELTLIGARLIATRLRTTRAQAFVRHMVRAFSAAKEQLAPPPPLPGLAVEAARTLEASSLRIRGLPEERRALCRGIDLAMLRTRLTRQRIVGEVRRVAKVPSEYDVTLGVLPSVLRHLDALADRRLLLPSRAKSAPPSDPRQTVIQFVRPSALRKLPLR